MPATYVRPAQKAGDMRHLGWSAIEPEIARLELALKLAIKRLTSLEELSAYD